MAGNDKLGSEWGALSGLPRDEALKILSEYATELETENESLKSGAGGNRVASDDDEEDEGVNGLNIAKRLKQTQTEPLAQEFVGRREAAKSKAAQNIRQAGQDWNRLEDYVIQVMSNATADLQTQPEAWVEAWWYVWGLEQRTKAQQPPQQDEDAQDEQEYDDYDEYEEEEEATPIPPRSEPETRVVQSGVSADRSSRSRPQNRNPNKIKDPHERRTKRHFEQYLGRKISDEDWLSMKEANTLEDYQRIQNKRRNK